MAGPLLNDRVRETTTTTGTGTINLAGAVSGYDTFVGGIATANTTVYAIIHQTAAEWEIGIGTVTDASPDTLSRTTILSSSNSDAAVNFSAGTKDVYCVAPALWLQKLSYIDLNAITSAPATAPAADSTDALAIGSGAVATSGARAIAIGTGRAAGADSLAMQITNLTSSYGSTGANSIAIGQLALASGANAGVLAGNTNTASGVGAACLGGENNTAGGRNSVAYGEYASQSIVGGVCQAYGRFAAAGDAQTATFILRANTTDATETELYLKNVALGTSVQLVLPNDTTWVFDILIVARRTDADNESAGYRMIGVIDRNATAASTALVGSVTTTTIGEDTAAWNVAATADTTNGALKITGTGAAATAVQWVAYVRLVQTTG